MQVNNVLIDKLTLPRAKNLGELHLPPAVLYAKGDLSLLDSTTLTVVGSRRPSPYGLRQTQSILSGLAGRAVTIVSGLALGIDAHAHRQAVANGLQTIAVLASGIDNIYPSSNRFLAQQILASGGLIISESEGDYVPFKHDFVKRNRLIAGLSDAIYIPEAALLSGSLHTARFGLDLGVPIFANPGQLDNPLSQGTNRLIEQGALIAWDSDLIATELKLPPKADLAPEQMSELEASLSVNGSSSFEDLVRRLSIEPIEILTELTGLEISGRAVNIGGLWSLN